MKITNIETYWKVVDENWDDLLNIIFHHIDPRHQAYEEPGQSDSKMIFRNGKLVTILEEVLFLKKNRDRKLVRYFTSTWCLASDAYAWSVQGWGTFCDLCSEEWVFDESNDYL